VEAPVFEDVVRIQSAFAGVLAELVIEHEFLDEIARAFYFLLRRRS
jgi:hypothetical protein